MDALPIPIVLSMVAAILAVRDYIFLGRMMKQIASAGSTVNGQECGASSEIDQTADKHKPCDET